MTSWSQPVTRSKLVKITLIFLAFDLYETFMDAPLGLKEQNEGVTRCDQLVTACDQVKNGWKSLSFLPLIFTKLSGMVPWDLRSKMKVWPGVTSWSQHVTRSKTGENHLKVFTF